MKSLIINEQVALYKNRQSYPILLAFLMQRLFHADFILSYLKLLICLDNNFKSCKRAFLMSIIICK
jgi:hypothetical protein